MRRAIALYAITASITGILPATERDDWVRLIDRAHRLENAGNYAQAVVSYLDTVRIAEELGSHDRRLVLTLNSLAAVYRQLGQFSEAEHEYRRALSLVKESGGQGDRDRGVLLANLVTVLVGDGQVTTGEGMLRDAMTKYSHVLSPDDVRLAAARNTLAELLMMHKRSVRRRSC